LAGGQKSTRRSGRLVRIAHFQTKATGLGNRPVPGRTQEQIGDLETFLADERAKLTKELTAARDARRLTLKPDMPGGRLSL
jgi:hypothetical protein